MINLKNELRLRGKKIIAFLEGKCPDCEHPIEECGREENNDYYGIYCVWRKYRCLNCGVIYEEIVYRDEEEYNFYINTKGKRIYEYEIEFILPWQFDSGKCQHCGHSIEQYEHDEKSDGGCHCDRSKYRCLNCGGIYEEYYSNERGEVVRYSFKEAHNY